MTSLLHVDSSASLAGDSVTRRLTASFADVWCRRHGTSGYRYRDLTADPVPLVSHAYTTLGRRVERHRVVPLARVTAMTGGPAEEREWALTLPLIRELLEADTVLVGVPMYNFTVPAALKAWIDRVTFPGAYVDPATEAGRLRDTTVVVVAARGGAYGPGTPREGLDFQTPYLRTYFRELGVAEENLHVVQAEMTRAWDVPALARFRELGDRSLADAYAAVRALADGGEGDRAFPQDLGSRL
ncbi:FMN-dependent NADH-azoreductase [Microbispora rosea]|uniref:FMN-dependent NADH-azoreductase n=1 Tax=Microbispora rosea TaxID=58117 RepID=UPI00068BD950|nr:NAD(P)H-dependent oxidoreductase [Microbispora rosea]